MQIGIGVVAVFVKTERLAPTVVTLCQCHEMDVKEEQRVAIAVKSIFRPQRLWNSFRRLTVMQH